MTKEERKALLDPVRTGGGVEVMKASAGSGKTYSLAREYIRLLLKNRGDDHPYRHILAVTFTNKATGEMKTRIIDSLDTLARYPEKSHYKDYLMEECGIESEAELQKECKKALTEILSDYSAFSVCTIDRFFQKVLRAFAREVGQFAEYQVELDRDSLVSETVDRVLDSLSEADEDLLEWLSSNSVESLTQGDGYRLSDTLGTFADGYMSESYRDKAEAIHLDKEKAFSAENLNRLKGICSEICRSYNNDLKKAATIDLATAEATVKLANADGIISTLKSIKEHGADRLGYLFTKKEQQYWRKSAEKGITANVYALGGSRFAKYNTAKILRSQIAVFHVADALDKQFKALLKEKNVLSLDDTNSILKDIISGSDAPFIYEKVGVRYHHFLLDEFQDTSSTQWENFKPLLINSIDEGCYNLIVGDVKQSIYRWRNARWDILDSKVQKELSRTVSNPLEANWRSAQKIVDFNNAFYKTWSEKMDAQLGAELVGSDAAKEAEERPIAEIYSDVRQEAHSRIGVPGSVEVTYCDKDSLYDQTIAAVLSAEERGFAPKDIAVIVRTNAAGQEIATRLTSIGRHVITSDSLRICSGKTVRTLVSRLYKIDNPEDKINTFYAGDFEYSISDSCKSLVDLCEGLLAQLPPEEVNSDTLYVLAFMDLVRDFVSKNGNSLHSFLEYWSEEGMKKSIASPDGTNAITVITIHSVKGLDYPCVILPLQKKEEWISSNSRFWEAPDVVGSPFEEVEPALYHTGLSSSSLNNLFAGNYLRELRMRYIDEANVWYVATTRASQAMHIIGVLPASAILNRSADSPWSQFSGFGGALYQYCNDTASGFVKDGEHYVYGTISSKEGPKERGWVKPMPPVTESELKFYPLGKATGTARSQVQIKTDSSDFFAPEGEKGLSASRRLRGTVLHGILETVIGPEDLHASVGRAVEDGLLSAEEAKDAERMLGDAIANVADRGWFPGDKAKLLNERDLITPSGEYKRPDRVVLKDDGSVEIVDYKFAMEKDSYVGQVQEYVASYKAMGYKDVKGYLWYVDRDYVSEV